MLTLIVFLSPLPHVLRLGLASLTRHNTSGRVLSDRQPGIFHL
jgi:hypothetical protein